MRQNDQVRKPTILAFVFIPLSLVSSIFGMNVAEFVNNAPTLRSFGIVAGCVTAGVLLVAALPIAHVMFRGWPLSLEAYEYLLLYNQIGMSSVFSGRLFKMIFAIGQRNVEQERRRTRDDSLDDYDSSVRFK